MQAIKTTKRTGRAPVCTALESPPDWRAEWKRRVALAKVSRYLSAGDLTDVRWYFHRERGFESSPYYGMWQRALLYSRGAVPCRQCGGSEDAAGSPGCGFEMPDGQTPLVPRNEEEARLLRLLEVELPSPLGDRVCSECDGKGWIIEKYRRNFAGAVSARPMGSSIKSKMGGSIEMSGDNIWRLGHVMRLLREATARFPMATLVFECFYSPGGEPLDPAEEKPVTLTKRRLEREAGLAGVWEITPAGKTMLKQNSFKLHPLQYFANQREEQRRKPKAARGDAFKAADDQAKMLVARSNIAWNMAKSGIWVAE